jgi:hypothetical protein
VDGLASPAPAVTFHQFAQIWISAFVLRGTDHQLTFGRKSIGAMRFNWGVRKGYLTQTPFRIGSEPAIGLEREIPRNKRLAGPQDEQRLLNAAALAAA